MSAGYLARNGYVVASTPAAYMRRQRSSIFRSGKVTENEDG